MIYSRRMQTLVSLPTQLAEPVSARLEAAITAFWMRLGSPSFSLQVLLAPCLLLRQAGCTAVPRGTHPAPHGAPGKNPPHLP